MSCDREFRESCRSRGRLNDHGIMPFIREAPRVVGLRNSAVPGRIEHHRATYLEVGAGGENELEIKCCDNPRFFCRRTAGIYLEECCAQPRNSKHSDYVLPIVLEAEADIIAALHAQCAQMTSSAVNEPGQLSVADNPVFIDQSNRRRRGAPIP